MGKNKTNEELENDAENTEVKETTEDGVKRGRGRPKGSKNKPKFQITPVVQA